MIVNVLLLIFVWDLPIAVESVAKNESAQLPPYLDTIEPDVCKATGDDFNLNKNSSLRFSSNRTIHFITVNARSDYKQFDAQHPAEAIFNWIDEAQRNKVAVGKVKIYPVPGRKSLSFHWTEEHGYYPGRIMSLLHMTPGIFDAIAVTHFPEKGLNVLQEAADVSQDFDVERSLRMIYDSILKKKSLVKLVEPMIKSLAFIKPDLSGFYPPPPKSFSEDQLADWQVEQLLGEFSLQFTSSNNPNHDHMVGSLGPNQEIKWRISKNKQHIGDETLYRVPNTRHLVAAYRPVVSSLPPKYKPFFPTNVRSVPSNSDVIHADKNHLVIYSFYPEANEESVNVYVRDGHPIDPKLTIKIPDPALKVLKELTAKIYRKDGESWSPLNNHQIMVGQ